MNWSKCLIILCGIMFVGIFAAAPIVAITEDKHPDLPQAEAIYKVRQGEVFKIKVDGVEYLIFPGCGFIRHDP